MMYSIHSKIFSIAFTIAILFESVDFNPKIIDEELFNLDSEKIQQQIGYTYTPIVFLPHKDIYAYITIFDIVWFKHHTYVSEANI